jgi:hypothetical protein
MDSRVPKRKRNLMSPRMSSLPKASVAFIMLAWIPAGLLGLWIGKRLPRNAQLPFFLFMIVAIIYYRLVGAQRLRKKWTQRSNH